MDLRKYLDRLETMEGAKKNGNGTSMLFTSLHHAMIPLSPRS